MYSNYHVSRFIVNERIDDQMRSAASHRLAKKARRSNKSAKLNGVIQSGIGVGYTFPELVAQIVGNFSRTGGAKVVFR